MSKRLYNYKLTFIPESPEFSSRNTKPVQFVSMVYGARSKRAAFRKWKKNQMPSLRANGLRAPISTPRKIERVTLAGNPR